MAPMETLPTSPSCTSKAACAPTQARETRCYSAQPQQKQLNYNDWRFVTQRATPTVKTHATTPIDVDLGMAWPPIVSDIIQHNAAIHALAATCKQQDHRQDEVGFDSSCTNAAAVAATTNNRLTSIDRHRANTATGMSTWLLARSRQDDHVLVDASYGARRTTNILHHDSTTYKYT